MSNSIPLHSEPDAVVSILGDAHFENGKLIIGDVDVARKIAATMGILGGGRQSGYFSATFTKYTVQVTTSDQGMGGAFYEESEPQVPAVSLG
jgi:hypothetical protein